MGRCRSPRVHNTVDDAEDAPSFRLRIIKSNFNDKSLRSNFCTRVVCCVCFSFHHRGVLFYFYAGCVCAPQESEKAGILRRKNDLFSHHGRIKARTKSFMSRRLSFHSRALVIRIMRMAHTLLMLITHTTSNRIFAHDWFALCAAGRQSYVFRETAGHSQPERQKTQRAVCGAARAVITSPNYFCTEILTES